LKDKESIMFLEYYLKANGDYIATYAKDLRSRLGCMWVRALVPKTAGISATMQETWLDLREVRNMRRIADLDSIPQVWSTYFYRGD